MITLSYNEWRTRAHHHTITLEPITVAYRSRRGLAEAHPVHDFLFQYYSFSSTKLTQWHPGWRVALELPIDTTTCSYCSYLVQDTRYTHLPDTNLITIEPPCEATIGKKLRWVERVLSALDQRPPRFGCYALHEWAMIYKPTTTERSDRHSYLPLRVCPTEMLSSLPPSSLQCTHYDAFRFFTPASKPLNALNLSKHQHLQHEQPGCIHITMDLYRWAFLMSPWIPGELLRSCFELAVYAREIDMRASPYDLTSLGYEPITIETAAGRRLFRTLQEELFYTSQPLRRELQEHCAQLLQVLTENDSHNGRST